MGPISQVSFRSGENSAELRRSAVSNLLPEPLIYGMDLPEKQTFTVPADPECRLVAYTDRSSAAAERFGRLASRLKYAQQRHSLRSVLITSAVPGDGKTMVATNLAITLAMHQQRTLIIDCDLRKPSLARLLGIESECGLAEWWKHHTPVARQLFREKLIPLWVLPGGIEVENPNSLLQSAEFSELLREMSQRFDWVIIDSPPLVPFWDAATIATVSDATVLVTRRCSTPKNLLQDILKTIDSKKIIATLLNDAKVTDSKYYRYYDRKPQPKLQQGLPSQSNISGTDKN
jgi:protein-tyrosine kinase